MTLPHHLLKMADNLLRQANPAWRARRKYRGELRWWKKELNELKRWYDGESDWYSIPPPRADQIQRVSPIWVTNAVATVHHMVPHYPEILRIKDDEFAGKKVLEVGCGPLAPIMQFRDCAWHGLDPLVDSYLRCGWPLYDYGVTFVNARGESMPYVDSYFDAIVSVNALDHVDDLAKVSSEIERVVKVGGRLYFEVEYHDPRPLEPQRIDDNILVACFTRCVMNKIYESSSKQNHELLMNRFDLLPDETAQSEQNGRLAVWHGERVR
jgi:SAM-dependent methyltransferase